MSQAIIRSQSPEERAYARYVLEIEERKRRLAELQADLSGGSTRCIENVEIEAIQA